MSKVALDALKASYTERLGIFGVVVDGEEELLDETIQALIDERTEARKNKDFARSDAIRDQLKAQGIILDDTAQGTRWRRSE